MTPTVDILLIEDNELDMKLFMSLLQDYLGLSVHSSKDALEALEWLEQFMPRLIHTDIMMPEVSGVEFVARLKARPEMQHIPLIMATAGAFAFSRGQLQALGIDAFFTKPISGLQYMECVKALLARERIDLVGHD